MKEIDRSDLGLILPSRETTKNRGIDCKTHYPTTIISSSSQDMRFPHFVAIFLIVALGYLGYKEGYLASLHPILDPSANAEVSPEDGEAAEEGEAEEERDATEEHEDDEPGSRSTTSQTKAAAAEARKRAKEEKEESDRLRREAREAERMAKDEAALAARAEKKAHNSQVNGEITELVKQRDEISAQLKTAKANLIEQERKWRIATIKMREEDKQKLRDASAAYQAGLTNQIREFEAQIKALRRQIK